VPDRADAATAIACRSLDPLLTTLHESLDDAGAGVAEDVLGLVAEAYATGHRDGVRHAVADIAPVAAAHGLSLRLAPDLCDEAADRGRPRRIAGWSR
jgi:hypothetical protein